jgi:hypothetical protein
LRERTHQDVSSRLLISKKQQNDRFTARLLIVSIWRASTGSSARV